MQFEEYALKLNAGDFACRSKDKAKPQRRTLASSSRSQEQFLLGRELGLMFNQGNILSPVMKYRRK